MSEARAIIDKLGMLPHPEGGWYRETWRAEVGENARASASAIHFLLEAGQRSHWHVVDAAEIWFWHAGGPLALLTAPDDDGPVERVVMGSDVLAGEVAQHVVAPGAWQAAEPLGAWTLVSCIVSPGFSFAGFTLAPPGWEPGATL